MRKILYTIAILSALITGSFAEEVKNIPVQKPASMSQQEWGARIFGAVEELRENPMFYEMLKDQKSDDPVIQEALRIYKERYLKK